jgi:antitoxin component of MazEF toxin-antitoxin module
MSFKTKVQLIRRKRSQQFYINFPSACAQMMDLRKGEVVEWVLTDDGNLMLKRNRKSRKAPRDGEKTVQQ